MNDKSKMIDFISHHLNYECERLVLAQGYTRRDDIVADVMVCGDELVIESNCPKEESDWITVREIYSHLRWRAMPVWEQKEWLRAVSRPAPATPEAQLDAFGDSLADKIASRLQNNNALLVTDSNLAPYRFQRDGEIWAVHFTVGQTMVRKHFEHHVGFPYLARLLESPHRGIESLDLAEQADPGTLELIEVERQQSIMERHDPAAITSYKESLTTLKAQRIAAQYKGNNAEIDVLTDKIDELETFLLPGKKKGAEPNFSTLQRQQEGKSKLELSIHKTVSTAIRRAKQKIRNKDMKDLADYLDRTVFPEGKGYGYAYAYRPPAPAPEWVV